MDRYVRVEQRKTEQPSIQENEVRIMAAGKMRNYISYATTLLTDKGHSAVVLKAMGRAINKTVTIAEIVKRRILGLHQDTKIGSVDITDTWEPLEEGLNRLETTRHVSVITTTLSTVPLDPTSIGYQAPLEEEFVKPLQETTVTGRGSGGGNGGNGGIPPGREPGEGPPFSGGNNNGGRRGSGGRGRGGGGRGRGGYGGSRGAPDM